MLRFSGIGHPGSFAYYMPHTQNHPFLQGTLVPCSGVLYLENKLWVQGVLIAARHYSFWTFQCTEVVKMQI